MRACFPCPRLSPTVPVLYTPPSRRLGVTACKRHKRKLGDRPTASRGKACTLLLTGYRVQAIPILGVSQNFSRKSKSAGDFGFACVNPVFPFSPNPAVDVLLYYICVLGN